MTKVFEVKGIASFPFIITVEAGDEEDASAIAEGIELTDLLVDRDDAGFDEVLVNEVSLLAKATSPW
jgi:hypothetical protein